MKKKEDIKSEMNGEIKKEKMHREQLAYLKDTLSR